MARKEKRELEELRRKKEFVTPKGGEYMGDDDDLTESDGTDTDEAHEKAKQESTSDDGIPTPVARLMFRKWLGYKQDSDLHRLKDIEVYRDWNIFLYMLARGLLSDYKL